MSLGEREGDRDGQVADGDLEGDESSAHLGI